MRRSILVVVLALACGALRSAGDDSDTPLPDDNSQAVALYQAAKNGNLDTVKDLIASGAPVDGHVGEHGLTPLMTAACKSHLEVLQYLIDYRATLDLPDQQGCTALLDACWTNHADCALALIDAGANVNLGSNAAQTPLMYAAMHGNDEVVAALIAHKAKVDATCTQGPALMWAANNNHLGAVKLLGAAGANPNLMPFGLDSPAYSALGCAACLNNLEMIDYLLGLGVKVDSTGTDGTTALMAAAQNGWPQAVEHLLDQGANPDLVQKDGRTALMDAACHGHDDCVQSLVNRKANIDATDPSGETALTMAGERGCMEIVQILKNKGAKRTDLHVIPKPMPTAPLSPAQAWALCVGLIYTQQGGSNFNLLGGGNSAERVKHLLKESWDVTDHDSLLRELDDLRDSGHRTGYQEDGAKLAAMSDDVFAQYLKDHVEDTISIKATRASYLKWKDRSALAWDLCRAGNLVNMGFAAHYLKEDEAWSRLMEIARLVQSHFSSWQEMNDNFFDGREIWNNGRDSDFEACGQLLLNPNDPNSPWNRNPWKTDLSETSAPAN